MSEIQDEDIITLTDENGNDVEFLLLDEDVLNAVFEIFQEQNAEEDED